MTLQRTKPL